MTAEVIPFPAAPAVQAQDCKWQAQILVSCADGTMEIDVFDFQDFGNFGWLLDQEPYKSGLVSVRVVSKK